MKAYRLKTALILLLSFSINLLLIPLSAQVPTIQDCLGAIPICEPIYVESMVPSGGGNYPNEINNSFCCMDHENNTIWYTFTVNQAGNFGFELIPNDLSDDYDWALFNITNADCADISDDPTLMVSCNAAGGGSCQGVTGANGNSSFQVQGAGCNNDPPNVNVALNPFNALVPVLQGNTYALVVSNWSGSTNGYTIDFGLSAGIDIYDVVEPTVQVVDYPEDCGADQLEVLFSENIKCASISAANFELTGPDGPYSLSLLSSICDVGGAYSKNFTLITEPRITQGGMYELKLVTNTANDVVDLCDNQTLPYTFPFEVDMFSISIDLGVEELTICETEFLALDISHSDPNASYLWHDGLTDSIRVVDQEGLYAVTVSTLCAEDSDQIQINYYVDTLELELGADTILCPGDSLLIDLSQAGISYLWQDGSTDPFFKIGAAGNYAVTISDGCGLATDEINVSYLEAISVDLGEDIYLCEGETKELNAYSPIEGVGYFWNVSDFDSVHLATKPGIYSVVVYSQCEQVYDEINLMECFFCDVYVPNVFSPNFDGTNDYFRPFSNCPLENYKMTIYNRWGAEVYSTSDLQASWDGTLHGKYANAGIYLWLIEYTVIENGISRSESIQGDILVVR